MPPSKLLIALLMFGGVFAGLGFFTLLFAKLVQFMEYLKSAHNEIWKSLGSPGIFNLVGGRSQDVPLHRYILGRRYRSIGDPHLTKLGNAVFLPLMTLMILCVSLIVFCWIRAFL